MSIELAWVGGRTFSIAYRGIRFYMEPCAEAGAIADADMFTVSAEPPLDGATLNRVLAESPKAKMLLPKSAAEPANALGIDYRRMTTTDAALRVEYFKDGEYGRIYGVPSARLDEQAEPQLDWTPLGGFPRIGFLCRFAATTVWHSGLGVPYAELADRLRPYSVNVAIVTLGAGTFDERSAAELAEKIDAAWLIPATGDASLRAAFVEHMLGHRPLQRFKLFEPGERWILPSTG